MGTRIGIGYDLHRTIEDRPLMLGGVRVDSPFGLDGHSDADVVLHAVCDALLGAIAQGDIGDLFPDTDPQYKGADSRVFVQEALRRVQAAGLRVGNADIIIHAQKPKLGAFKERIRESVAALIDAPLSAVGVKATTNERLDAVGRGEAIACWAAVLLTTP